MKAKALAINLVAIGIFMTILVSCNNQKTGSISQTDRLELNNELKSLRSQLPYEIAGTGVYITSVEVGDSCVELTGAMPQEIIDLIVTVDSLNTDRSVSRAVLGLGEICNYLVEKNVGITYRYENMSTGQELCTVVAGPERLKRVMNEVKSGDTQPYSLLEVCRIQASSAQYPIDMGDGTWMTNAYVEGNSIYYEYRCDFDLVIDNETEEIIKEEIENEIVGNALFTFNKDRAIDEDVHLVYIYKSKKGKILSKIDISLKDLFQNI